MEAERENGRRGGMVREMFFVCGRENREMVLDVIVFGRER